MELTELQLRILAEFRERHTSEPWDEDKEKKYYWNTDERPCIRYNSLVKLTGLAREEIKPAVIGMRNMGIIELQPTVEWETCIPSGSGWFLTKKGCDVINEVMPYQEPTTNKE